MKFDPIRKQSSLVILGDFNPNVFHPEWFCKNSIISPEEADLAKSDTQKTPLIITPQLTMFSTSQFSIRVETNRFTVVCEKEPIVTMVDFILKTFEKLGGIPIKAYGINYSAHYACDSLEEYQKVGDNLAPKSFWDHLLGDEVTGENRKSGLSRIQMIKYKQNEAGHILMTLEPSNLVKTGIYIACNNHTVVPDEDNFAESVVMQIGDSFSPEIQSMQTLQEGLLERAIKQND